MRTCTGTGRGACAGAGTCACAGTGTGTGAGACAHAQAQAEAQAQAQAQAQADAPGEAAVVSAEGALEELLHDGRRGVGGLIKVTRVRAMGPRLPHRDGERPARLGWRLGGHRRRRPLGNLLDRRAFDVSHARQLDARPSKREAAEGVVASTALASAPARRRVVRSVHQPQRGGPHALLLAFILLDASRGELRWRLPPPMRKIFAQRWQRRWQRWLAWYWDWGWGWGWRRRRRRRWPPPRIVIETGEVASEVFVPCAVSPLACRLAKCGRAHARVLEHLSIDAAVMLVQHDRRWGRPGAPRTASWVVRLLVDMRAHTADEVEIVDVCILAALERVDGLEPAHEHLLRPRPQHFPLLGLHHFREPSIVDELG